MRILLCGILLVVGLAVTYCGLSPDLDDSSATALEAGITAATNSLDDLTTSAGFARGTCSGRAVSSLCSGGIKTKAYDACTLGAGLFTLDGDVTLTYSDSGCNMVSNGNSVLRTFDLSATGAFGGTTRSTSDAHTTWDGTVMGEGATVEKTSAGHTLSIHGLRRTRSRFSGSQVFDFSIRTLSTAPIVVEGSTLDWSDRILRSGTLQVHHNLAEFTTTLEIANLMQASDCCYPTSGTITFSQTGSITAAGTVVYTGCGSGTVTVGAESTTFSYSSCQ